MLRPSSGASVAVYGAYDARVGELVVDHEPASDLPDAAAHRGSRSPRAGSDSTISSTYQPVELVYSATREASKFEPALRQFGQPAPRPPARGIRAVAAKMGGLDPARGDDDSAFHPASRELDYALEDRGPHVQLDLLGQPQVRVHEVREAVAAARPGLDREFESAMVGARAELDLPGLEMTPQAWPGGSFVGLDGDHAHGPVPGPRHPNYVLVAQRERSACRRASETSRILTARCRRGRRRCAPRAPRASVAADDPRAVDPVHQRPRSVLGAPVCHRGLTPPGNSGSASSDGEPVALPSMHRRSCATCSSMP